MRRETILLAGAFVLMALSLPGLTAAQDFGRCCYGDTLDPDCVNLTVGDCKSLGNMISWYRHIRCEDLCCLEGCCILPGDVNCDGTINILDASGSHSTCTNPAQHHAVSIRLTPTAATLLTFST